MKFQVIDLENKIIASFKDEYSMDRWLIEQIQKNDLKIGKFRVKRTISGSYKEAVVDKS